MSQKPIDALRKFLADTERAPRVLANAAMAIMVTSTIAAILAIACIR